jgi:hypothetical protein
VCVLCRPVAGFLSTRALIVGAVFRLALVITTGLAAPSMLALTPRSAHAQVGRTPDIGPVAAPSRKAVEPRLRMRTLIEDGEPSDTPAPALPASAESEPPDETLATDPNADEGRPPLARQPVVADGTAWPVDPATPQDGNLVTTEAATAVDGVLDPAYDTRGPEDIAAFQKPAPGFDPNAFAIEVDPFRDREPRRFFRFEPYEAIGVRIGSFVVLPEVEIGAAAYSNVFHSSTNPRSDFASEVRPAVRAVSDWGTHALEFRAAGIASFHDEFSSENDRDYTVESRGRLDITRRTNIEALVGFDRSQESRGSINEPITALDRTNVDTRRAALALNQRFNRLSVQLRGTYTDYEYSPVETPTGTVSNDDRDYQRTTGAVRVAYAFKPELGIFADTEWNSRDYHAAPADGILRDSSGEQICVGVAFGNYDRILRGDVSVGWGEQRYDDNRLTPVSGALLDANVAWRVSGLTSVLFKATTDIGESTLAGSGGALSRTGGVEVRHAFRRDLIATAGVSAARQHYEGTDIIERDVRGLLGLEYYVSREVTLFSRYQHIDFESTDISRNYNADEFRVGVRLRR